MVNSSTVTAIKGQTITGQAYLKLGVDREAVEVETDWEARGYEEFAIVSSEDGIGFGKTADSSLVKGWGDVTHDEIWSNNSASVTVNIISFTDVNSLRALFGSANVTKDASGVTTVKIKATNSSEHVSIAILGLDKNGKTVLLHAGDATIDPNFEFTWNDQDPVAIPAVFNLWKDPLTDEFGTMLIDGEPDAPLPISRTASSSTEA